jgi:hypothetical protein
MASLPGSLQLLQTPLLQQKCRLTACRSVSCYRVSAGPNRARGEGPVKMGRLRRMNALLLRLESCC